MSLAGATRRRRSARGARRRAADARAGADGPSRPHIVVAAKWDGETERETSARGVDVRFACIERSRASARARERVARTSTPSDRSRALVDVHLVSARRGRVRGDGRLERRVRRVSSFQTSSSGVLHV